MDILLVTPPLLQPNTPYPATPFLTGHLRSRGFSACQADLSLGLLLDLFSPDGLAEIGESLRKLPAKRRTEAVESFLQEEGRYRECLGPALRFLQGRDPSLAHRIASRNFLPEGPWFRQADDGLLADLFGTLGVQDLAKHLASLFLDDVATAIRDGIDPRFEFGSYAEKLASNLDDFSLLQQALENRRPTLVERRLDTLAGSLLSAGLPGAVGLAVPFPGNLYGALRIARALKRLHPKLPIILGGGYVNTELRDLSEPRLFDHVDFVTLDDGERPLECLLEHLQGRRNRDRLFRTFVRDSGGAGKSTVVRRISDPKEQDVRMRDTGTPTYDGLPLCDYFPLLEKTNPMHRLWSDGRWNKLVLAHGCYWHRCTFCDTGLDYIRRYDPLPARMIADRMEALMAETGESGFHFIDEAAPPALLRQLCAEIRRRRLAVSWWVNIRFEAQFTAELAAEMAETGCIAVSGGLEAASDRLLQCLGKGVDVAQAATAMHHLSDHGLLIHAYLIYGVPSQTLQETVDALERVRQLFAAGCLHSAYWHRLAATVHSDIGRRPEAYGIAARPPPLEAFARNEVPFTDPVGDDPGPLAAGLRKALYNYMLGIGLDSPVGDWFDFPVPKPKVPRRYIESIIRQG